MMMSSFGRTTIGLIKLNVIYICTAGSSSGGRSSSGGTTLMT
jgi:hypothetical protein